jgi:hypothetical protein
MFKTQIAPNIMTEPFGSRVVNIITVSGFYPKLIIGAFGNAYYKIIVKAGGIALNVFVYLKFIPVVLFKPDSVPNHIKPLLSFKIAFTWLCDKPLVISSLEN